MRAQPDPQRSLRFNQLEIKPGLIVPIFFRCGFTEADTFGACVLIPGKSVVYLFRDAKPDNTGKITLRSIFIAIKPEFMAQYSLNSCQIR